MVFKMDTLVLEQKYTYADYRELDVDDNLLYELLNGDLVKKSAPSPQHQTVVVNLLFAIKSFINEKNKGRVFVAPIDVFLDDYNVPQPDLIFISEAKKGIITQDGIMGVPDLVVEVISPSSWRRDRFEKMKLYKKYEIPEFWLIDPQNQSIEVFTYADNDFDVFSLGVETDEIQSKVLDGFSIKVKTIFE
jgi:Uma2 family endonuclease